MNKLFRLVPHAIALSCVLTVAGCAEETIVVTCKGKESHYPSYCSSWTDRGNREPDSTTDVSRTYTLEKNWRNPDTQKIEWIMTEENGLLAKTSEHIEDKDKDGAEYFSSAILRVDDQKIYYHRVSENGFKPNKSHGDRMNQRHTNDTKLTINRLTGEWLEERVGKNYWIDDSYCVSTFIIVGTCQKAAKKF